MLYSEGPRHKCALKLPGPLYRPPINQAPGHGQAP